ncbi:MAG: WD40 repeat domain-containing serine/threonine protein kinase [Sandaracinus sp.]
MASGSDTEKDATTDPALARTLASGEGAGSGERAPIPSTNTPETDLRTTDPALAPTMMPGAHTSLPGRAGTTLTSEHPGRYVRAAELGRGGMGRVLVVKDTHLGREVALKELLEQGPPGQDAMSVGSAARFLREARITGQLEHPGIVPVHELGQRPDGTIYYTMKRIRGRSLASVLKEKHTLAERLTLLGVFRAVCEAVAYAHSEGVVHRDLKPDNVMVGEFGDTLVVDWGLAKVRGEAEIPGAASVSGQSGRTSAHDDLARTVDGHAIGTPAYMSPEQARGELSSIDERADVWGLGAILFELLAGRPPYVGTSALDVLSKVLDDPPPRVRAVLPDAPPELAAIVDRALMRDPSSRYPNAGEVAKEIRAYLDGRTVGAYEYSAWELAARFVRRHRAASIAGVSIVLSIVVASALVYRSLLDESRARTLAETARDEAMRERSVAEDSMHEAESALADALLERAERALATGDASGAAVFAAGVLVRDSGAAMHAPPERRVRALTLYVEADARRRYVFERFVAGAHVRSTLSDDGRFVVIPTETATRIVDLVTGDERRIDLHATRVRAATAAGIAVVAGTTPGLYDLEDGHLVRETPAPMGASTSEEGILVSTSDGTVIALSPDGTSELARWQSDLRGQVRAAWTSPGRAVAVVSTESTELELWRWPHAGPPERVTLRALPYVVAFSPRGSHLAVLASDFVGVADRGAEDWPSPLPIAELPTSTWPTAMTWIDDATLALYENGDRLALRDASDGHALDVVHFPGANGGRIEAAGEHLVFFPGESRTSLDEATVMRAVSGVGRVTVQLPAGVRDVQLDPARHRVVAATLRAVYGIPLLASGRLGAPTVVAELPAELGIVEHARVASDGAVVVLTLRGGLVVVEPDGTLVRVAEPSTDYGLVIGLRGLAISPDGQTIFWGGPTEGVLRRWSRAEHAEQAPFTIPDAPVQSLAVSPDGAQLAVGGHDGSLGLVRIHDGTIEHAVTRVDAAVSDVAFSPDGAHLVAVDASGRVRSIDPVTGRVEREAQALHRFVNGVSWSRDGRWIVCASDEPSVHVLSAVDLSPARILRPSTAPIAASFAPDSAHLVLHEGREVEVLDLRMTMSEPSPAELLRQAEERAGVHLDELALVRRDGP